MSIQERRAAAPSTRRSLSVTRIVLALLAAVLISGLLLLAVHFALTTFMESTALRPPYITIAVITAVIIFIAVVIPARSPVRPLKNILRVLIIILVPLALFGGSIIRDAQGLLMYMDRFEIPDEYVTEAQSVEGIESITITDDRDTTYSGLLWRNTTERAGLVLYFGGNAEFAAASIPGMAMDPAMADLWDGYNFLMMDYPGYGESEGRPNEQSIYRMAEATWEQMRTRDDVDPDRIIIAGWSLGTGTAAHLAATRDVQGLILMSPFLNGASLVNDYAAQMFSDTPREISFTPNHILLRDKFRSDQYAADTEQSVLLIGATRDTIIPVEQSRQLAERYPKARYVEVSGSHDASRFGADANAAIAEYLELIN